MVAHESSLPARLPRSFPSQAPSLETPEQRDVLTLTAGRKEKKRDAWRLKSGSMGKERRQTDGFSLNTYQNLSTCLRATARQPEAPSARPWASLLSYIEALH